MNRFEEFLEFIKKHKVAITVGGITLSVAFGYVAYRYYMQGVRTGAILGFHETMKWFDKNFENMHLKELWEQWAAAHPEQVVY